MLRHWVAPVAVAVLGLGLFGAAGSAAAAPAAPAGLPKGFNPGGSAIRARESALPNGPFKTLATANWSGYARVGNHGAFTSVSADWKQPGVRCPSGTKQESSFLVGLDGWNLKDRHVEETGTGAYCIQGKPQYYAFCEIYPASPVTFDVAPKPGDSMSASVTFLGDGKYEMFLRDNTRGWTRRKVEHKLNLPRTSAEVITGMNNHSLPDFGKVTYTNAAANGQAFHSNTALRVVIVDSHDRPRDSTSTINEHGDFSNSWIRSN